MSDVEIDGEYTVVDEENEEETETKQSQNEEAVKAEALIKKAETLMDDAESEDQEELVEMVEAIRDALKAADGTRLDESMHELNEIIFYLES